MTDRYQQFATSAVGKLMVSRLGLPAPIALRRYEPGQSLLTGPALLGGSGRLVGPIEDVLVAADAEVAKSAGDEGQRYGALIFDASGIESPDGLRELYEFFHPVIRRVKTGGRVLVFGTPPESVNDIPTKVAQRALEGFTRSVAKELKRGATAQLVYVAPGAEGAIGSTVRFFASAKSAYVDAQVVRIGVPRNELVEPDDWAKPLEGKVALVTGA